MTTAIAQRPNGMSYTGAQLNLIRQELAPDCTPSQFDLYLEMAHRCGLDPIRKEIYAVVFNKNNPDKRRLAIITGIDGYRRLAYQGAASRGVELRLGPPAVHDIDQSLCDPETNPKGIRSTTVTWFVSDRAGEWHEASQTIDWDEFAPLEPIWEFDQAQNKRVPTGKFALPKFSPWRRMAKVMITKCCEAQLLRRLAPETLAGLYAEGEMDRAVVEGSAWELAEQAAAENRLALAGVKDMIPVILDPETGMEAIPVGQFADRMIEAMRIFNTASDLDAFWAANKIPRGHFHGTSAHDSLALKREFEEMRAKLPAVMERGEAVPLEPIPEALEALAVPSDDDDPWTLPAALDRRINPTEQPLE